jgi:transcriptional regulator of NAD metabolism
LKVKPVFARSRWYLAGMREFFNRLLVRLHQQGRPLSRNKHFHTFTGETHAVLRVDRHLRDLEEHLDLLRTRNIAPKVRGLRDGSIQLILRHPDLALVRTATLSAEEAALLVQHPAGAWALGVPEASQTAEKPAAKQG